MILLFVGLLSISLTAQEKKAEITFKSDVVDYGEVSYGSDGIREFEFRSSR